MGCKRRRWEENYGGSLWDERFCKVLGRMEEHSNRIQLYPPEFLYILSSPLLPQLPLEEIIEVLDLGQWEVI